jgi:hypothetical protein
LLGGIKAHHNHVCLPQGHVNDLQVKEKPPDEIDLSKALL